MEKKKKKKFFSNYRLKIREAVDWIKAREYPNKISAIIKLCGQKNRNTGKIVYYKFLRTLQPEMLPPKCQPNFDAVKEDLIQSYCLLIDR